jgi:hypothetical protein
MNDSISASVFLGMPAIITAEQEPYLEQWLEWLEDHALEVVRLERAAYGRDPWLTLTELLSRTDGVLLLGFRQLDARTGIWRPRTTEEVHAAGWWTSPWLQLEAGMAVALGLPVLLASDEGVAEGVFSPDVWGSRVRGTALRSPGETGAEWIELVREHWISRRQATS